MKRKYMKVTAIALLLVTTAFAYTYGQCQGTTKAGKQCTRGVSNPGDIYCFQHK